MARHRAPSTETLTLYRRDPKANQYADSNGRIHGDCLFWLAQDDSLIAIHSPSLRRFCCKFFQVLFLRCLIAISSISTIEADKELISVVYYAVRPAFSTLPSFTSHTSFMISFAFPSLLQRSSGAHCTIPISRSIRRRHSSTTIRR